MAITYEIYPQEDLLLVVAKGEDDSINDVIAYTDSVIHAALKHNLRSIVCDETQLVYKLGVLDNYQLAEYLAKQVDKVVRVAIVTNPKNLKSASFYETAVNNRGISIRFFKDMEPARNWVKF